jgi:hypothetical protein
MITVHISACQYAFVYAALLYQLTAIGLSALYEMSLELCSNDYYSCDQAEWHLISLALLAFYEFYNFEKSLLFPPLFY